MCKSRCRRLNHHPPCLRIPSCNTTGRAVLDKRIMLLLVVRDAFVRCAFVVHACLLLILKEVVGAVVAAVTIAAAPISLSRVFVRAVSDAVAAVAVVSTPLG